MFFKMSSFDIPFHIRKAYSTMYLMICPSSHLLISMSEQTFPYFVSNVVLTLSMVAVQNLYLSALVDLLSRDVASKNLSLCVFDLCSHHTSLVKISAIVTMLATVLSLSFDLVLAPFHFFASSTAVRMKSLSFVVILLMRRSLQELTKARSYLKNLKRTYSSCSLS